MSHAMGRMCGDHHEVIDTIRCPEGCGNHGWANEPCSPACPKFAADQTEETP